MHLDALKHFIDIVEEKSISKAAKKVHMSQSALSQTIQKLEDDLGYTLLNRSNKGVTITSFGEIVLKYAMHVIRNMDKMIDELDRYDTNYNRISISGTWSLASYSLPCMLYKVKKKFPDIGYDLVGKDNVAEIISALKEDLIDFGFIDIKPEEKTLSYHKMGSEKMVLVAKQNYKVDTILDVMELLNIEMIMCTMNKTICHQLNAILESKSMSLENLNIIFNADSLAAVKSSVMNGYGMAFVPYQSIKRELYEKTVKEIKVVGLDLNYDIYMVCKKLNDLSISAKKLQEYLIKVGWKSFC